MMKELLNNCLYFTANHLAREVGKMSDEEFAKIGLSSTYAFLVLVVEENPGITLTDLCEILQIAPSTGTRFVDKLIIKDLVERKSEGKLARIFPTAKAAELHDDIQKCWDRLYDRYSLILGREAGDQLTEEIRIASDKVRAAAK